MDLALLLNSITNTGGLRCYLLIFSLPNFSIKCICQYFVPSNIEKAKILSYEKGTVKFIIRYFKIYNIYCVIKIIILLIEICLIVTIS